MAKKTNKTSHVLNLITNGSAPEPEESGEEKTDEAEGKKPGEKSAGSGETAEKAASASQSAVKAAEGGASGGGASTAEPALKEPASKEPGLKESIPRITSSGDKTVIVVDEASQKTTISNKILDRLTDQLEEEIQGKLDNYRMVNVMEQILKRMNLFHYMEQYDVCRCSRCQADVLALILTRLPAKYVVVDESTTAPIIGFYESKFRVRILTEVIKACMDVKENPRHERNGPYDK